MQTQWPAWRRQLASARKGGIEFKAIRRGVPYSLVLTISADYSEDSFAAALSLSPDSTSVVASFAVEVEPYSDGYTNVTLSLTEAQVNALPGDPDIDGLTELVFDFLHTPVGGDQQLLLGGTIPVIGKVTP